ncbi:hypothetical protein ACFSTE_02355 [Aquimarina hainanensis]|uniref:Helix-turn-helix type 11 domain-containing protein n=1 Tax=Aquimarina hainanensis TaxID=1578017 RepID=A0ABW5N443_9FLAO|nr:hypothetical protein [Aquimarina sp. TRL1]QKX04244.1 hypothetical protein HN014_04735 [Aquimarina sp. TRL1]
MKRSYGLLEKRRMFVHKYISENQDRQMKIVVSELSERLFLSERTIYNIINQEPISGIIID